MQDNFLYNLRNNKLKSHGNYHAKKDFHHQKNGNIKPIRHSKNTDDMLVKISDLQNNLTSCLTQIADIQKKQLETTNNITKTVSNLLELLANRVEISETQRDLFVIERKKQINHHNESQKNLNNKYKPKIRLIDGKNNQKKQNKIFKPQNTCKGLDKNTAKSLFISISSMRKRGFTWKQVLETIQEKNPPTLTGNGTWSTSLLMYFHKTMIKYQV